MAYSVYLLYANGRGSYLSVKGRSEWKTRRVATSYATGISQLKTRDGIMQDLVEVRVETEDGLICKSFEVKQL